MVKAPVSESLQTRFRDLATADRLSTRYTAFDAASDLLLVGLAAVVVFALALVLGVTAGLRGWAQGVGFRLDDALLFVALLGVGFTVLTARRWRDLTNVLGERDELAEQVAERADQLRAANEDLERAVANLKRSNAELEQFAYVASHDLREPLRVLKGTIVLLDRRHGDELPKEDRELFDLAVGNAERMEALVRDLLDYSRLDQKEAPREDVDLGAVLEQVRANLALAIEDVSATIEGAHLPVVEGDPVQLRQLLQNLVHNALKFHGDDAPRVRVSAERDGGTGRWVVTVADNGPGIPEAERERVFLLFRRLHRSDEADGTGIGLATCKKIVERHGGTIRIEDTPGGGATFRFDLPAA